MAARQPSVPSVFCLIGSSKPSESNLFSDDLEGLEARNKYTLIQNTIKTGGRETSSVVKLISAHRDRDTSDSF